MRADAIKTDTEGLDAGDTKIKVADGDMPGYFARPKGASNPPVVLVAMEIFGLHEYIKDVTRRLAKLGAFAVAPDYYFIPVASVEALKAALAENKKAADFKIYPGAPHGFHADYRASYRKEAAEDAWNQMQAWLKKYNVLG